MNTTIKLPRRSQAASAKAGNSCWMGQAGEQLVGKVSGKVPLSALLDIGSYENNGKFTQKQSQHSPPRLSSDSSDVCLQFLELERGLSKHTHTHRGTPVA